VEAAHEAGLRTTSTIMVRSPGGPVPAQSCRLCRGECLAWEPPALFSVQPACAKLLAQRALRGACVRPDLLADEGRGARQFGHVEGAAAWARHLVALRALQARTGGITEFVPLPFVHMEAPIYLRGTRPPACPPCCRAPRRAVQRAEAGRLRSNRIVVVDRR